MENNINNVSNNYEIELSENFNKENNKDYHVYSLIPSNYEKISNNDYIKESNFDKNKNQFNKIVSKLITKIKQIYSQLFFKWCYDIIKQGEKSKLNISSLKNKNILREYSSEKLFNNILPLWDNYSKLKEKKSDNILFKILIQLHLKKIFLASLLLLIVTILDFGGIIVYNELLKRFNKEENNININNDYNSLFNLKKYSLLNLILYMIIYTPITFILHFQAVYICEFISSLSQSQLKSLIYDKILKKATYINTNFNHGKIINLFQSNTDKFGNLITSLPDIFSLPFKIIYSIILLLKFFGYTIIPCIIILMLLFFLFYKFGKKQNEYENELMEISDKKMEVITQTFNIIKIIKLNVWEKLFIKKIQQVKNSENTIMRKKAYMTLIVNSSYWNTETILVFIIVFFYLLKYHNLDNSDLLTTMFIFYNIIDQLYNFPNIITNINDTFLSLKRIQKFLQIPNHDKEQIKLLNDNSDFTIDINNIDFGVIKSNKDIKESKEEEENKKINGEDNNDNEEKLLEEENNKEMIKVKLLKDINIQIKKGEHIGIIGKVGSGKSCLINSFINNLLIINDDENNNNDLMEKNKIINILDNISYVSQNPLILNDTFRNNILFFNEMNEVKYNKVISICQLEPDLKLLKNGDETDISEKDINLSGGQKMRLAIARAIYSEANIYIFDDPLSALDSYVGMNLFKEVFNNFLKNKTVIISTHSLQYLNFFDRIIFMETGSIKWIGPPQEILNQSFYDEFSKLINKNNNNENSNANSNTKEKINKDEQLIGKFNLNDNNKNNGDIDEKNIKYKDAFIFFIRYSGGIEFCIKVLFANIIWKVSQLLSDFYISKWSEKDNFSGNKNNIYIKLVIFTIISLCSVFGVIYRQRLMDNGLINFNIKMHEVLINKLIHASLNLFHDITPKGKIYNLINTDLTDASELNLLISRYIRNIFQILGSIIVCLAFNKYSLILLIIIFYIEYLITIFYLPASKQINELHANSRTPNISIAEETLNGIPIIRSIHKEKKFREKFYEKLDENFTVIQYQNGIYCWLIIHLNLVSNLLSAFILIFCYFFKSQFNTQSLGLLLKYSILISDQLFEIMIGVNDFGKNLSSVSRCERYIKIPQEKYAINNNSNVIINKNIFNKGKIKFENFSVKYRPNEPLVLKNINLEINPGEKIGVVGRTGGGKTTLSLCLFRILEAEKGKIFIDNNDISQLDLLTLRQNISIIPQEPILIEGSLRYNIDPYNNFKDEEINTLIKELNLNNFMKGKNLEYKIEENGNNLSVGERQLICIIRSLLRKNKIIIMDEATSSIDYKTENIIQNAIDKAMNNCTVITIAHRIKTVINYNRIMVISNGQIIEFDTPENLLSKKGQFYLLYQESIN